MAEEEKKDVEIKPMIEEDHESLLIELKERARYIEIHKRKKFENQLLQLAKTSTNYSKRNYIYEVLVSLQAIWNQNQPVKELQKKFEAAFQEGNHKEAEEYYKKLVKQGLDYIRTFQTGAGEIIPLDIEENTMLLHYDKKELTFYTLQLEQLEKISLPESLAIIHVYVETETGKIENSIRKMWILLEDKDGKKIIISTSLENINAIKLEFQRMEDRAISLCEKLNDVHRLSCFQNQLLLMEKKAIYYRDTNEKWQKLYTTKTKITAFESTRMGFWVGHSNGSVIILKKLQHVRNRDAFKGFTDTIKGIRGTNKYVTIFSKNSLKISDFTGNPVSIPLYTRCEIMQATIFNDAQLLHLANGMLVARDLNQGNILWQMNLGISFDYLFVKQPYVYCVKKNGTIMLFEIPRINSMANDLESKNIHVEKTSFDIEPTFPIRNISNFIGRQEILNEIKEISNAHFLIHSEPRMGKTSLLNVLRDVLTEKARCCVIDMEQLLKETESYNAFELKFIEKCLAQHLMKNADLPGIGGHSSQGFCSLVIKIKENKNFCVFGLDNFFIPSHFDSENLENFKRFLCSMFFHPDVRIILTCNSLKKNDIEKYIDELRISSQRKFYTRKIPLFSEGEVKIALRKKISLRQTVIDNIYIYTGRFPHLIHFYDRWKPGLLSIDEQSYLIARIYSEKIFAYFRDLGLDARLLFAICLNENLLGERTNYTCFYDNFPFLNNGLPKDQLIKAIKEIEQYGSGLSVEQEAETFRITLSDDARLFYEAFKNISWIKNFKTLYDFISAPSQESAQKIAETFTKITQSNLEQVEKNLEQIAKKHKDIFYINKLTGQGLLALKMPLATFIVIPLTRWRKEVHVEAFQDLCLAFQEVNRKAGEPILFYTLLFELHGAPKEEVKKDLAGIDRISIIEATMMKDIILVDSPKDKASDYIFDQLSIKERSPYTTAGAVPDTLFFGREMEIALIRGLPENIGVFGTRTIGKTSLLRRIHKTFKGQKGWKVYNMDCSRIESEKTLLKNLSEKMEVDYKMISDLDKFRSYVTRDAETHGHRYLFLLDEVDRLVEYDIQHDEKIFNTFNRLCTETMKNNETAARFILCGFQQMFEQMKNPSSRLYNFMVFLPLQALDIEGALNLVTGPIENIRIRWKDKEDARYLVESCSRHPRLLQAACNALLINLDDKPNRKDIIERADVDKALISFKFRDICMRLYHDSNEEMENENHSNKEKKVEKTKSVISPILSTDTIQKNNKDTEIISQGITALKRKEFLEDIHRITILAAVSLLFEKNKENFSLVDIQSELKGDGIDVSPNTMRNILDRLCLSGNFRLSDGLAIIAKDETKIQQQVVLMEIDKENLTIDQPDVYVGNDTTFPRFTFEFGVKIFPKLLVAHFGGMEQCKEERKKLIEKGAWKEWLQRH